MTKQTVSGHCLFQDRQKAQVVVSNGALRIVRKRSTDEGESLLNDERRTD